MANYFRGSTTENPVLYKCGDTMRFELELVQDGSLITCPLFKWEIYGDDGAKSSGTASGETGRITLETSISKPGFVRVIVTACDIEGKPLEGFDKFEGGAGADIDKIEQGVADPEDFDEFWAKQRELLETVEPVFLEKVRVQEDNPDFEIYDVKIAAPGNRPASGYLSYPKNAAPGSCKGKLCFMGYSVTTAPITTEKDTVILYINIHGIENGKDARYYDNLREGELAGFAFKNNETPETCYIRNVILRDLQAARVLRSLPMYDGQGITVCGGSMGAMQATNVAANIDDAKKLVITVPWLCDLGGIEIGRMRGWRPNFELGVRYYDTVSQAKRVKCPVDITCGLGDYVCPPSGQIVLWHNFKTEKKITFVQNKTHPYTPPEQITYTL
ncbi:MAG: acetylxylan esterase [Clostridia bacterium]|nr:acetylxylan esterase [Clostridia bacterium]